MPEEIKPNLIKENDSGFVKITKRFAIILAILLILGVSSMAYVVARASSWAYSNFVAWKADASQNWDVVSKLQGIFKTSSEIQLKENVKVVSEESQVVDVVKNASPAVVSIIASAEVPKLDQCYQDNNFYNSIPPEFRGFFDFPSSPQVCQNGTQIVRVGAGSGFVVSADGYILTNKHVVDNQGAEYTVVLNDQKNYGKKIPARVIARDPENDIAVLKIEMNNLPYLNFGDSDKLQVGQTAIAIGYALGQFDNTVSKGVVSGLFRTVDAVGEGSIESLKGLIQTDAAINPGNSGGPLLDIGGSVVGMNVAKADAQSIGFAVPINVVKKAYEQARALGKITVQAKPFVGVRYMAVTTELKSSRNLPFDYGMLVVKGQGDNEPAVVGDSPADKAGIKEGDIILEADGSQLNELNLLSDVVGKHKIGDEITLRVYSGGNTREVKIKLAGK